MFYAYHCGNCGDFEITRSIHDEPLQECPKCVGKVYQLWNVPAIIWKGNFRFMKGDPEVDMDKIEAEQNKKTRQESKNKIKVGLTRERKYF